MGKHPLQECRAEMSGGNTPQHLPRHILDPPGGGGGAPPKKLLKKKIIYICTSSDEFLPRRPPLPPFLLH